MLKKSASSVLASFRPSSYPRGYDFGPSLAAAYWTAFLSILRECIPVVIHMRPLEILACQHNFPQPAIPFH